MKTVIEMAREAGFKEHNGMIYVTTINDDCAKELERFAELVRKEYSFTHAQMWLKRFDDAIKAEREACAEVCENIDDYDENVDAYYSDTYAKAIRERSANARARGNT